VGLFWDEHTHVYLLTCPGPIWGNDRWTAWLQQPSYGTWNKIQMKRRLIVQPTDAISNTISQTCTYMAGRLWDLISRWNAMICCSVTVTIPSARCVGRERTAVSSQPPASCNTHSHATLDIVAVFHLALKLVWNTNNITSQTVRLCCYPFFMKLFRTSNTEIIAECQHYFGSSLPTKLIERKRNKFVNNYKNVSLL